MVLEVKRGEDLPVNLRSRSWLEETTMKIVDLLFQRITESYDATQPDGICTTAGNRTTDNLHSESHVSERGNFA